MKVVETDGFEFQFEDALEAFVFDETDSAKPNFHGVPMKAVDIVAEFAEAYVYVELKDYDDSSSYDILGAVTEDEKNARQGKFKWLRNYLKDKFRDSFLYRHAERKVDKPVHYVCLVTFDNALNNRMQKSLRYELPVGRASRRWVQELAKSCHVVNVEKWDENFPRWRVSRLTAKSN